MPEDDTELEDLHDRDNAGPAQQHRMNRHPRLGFWVRLSVLLPFMLTVLTVNGESVAAAGRTPSISDFMATPASLPITGGQLKLTATVANAKICTFNSIPSITGLPVTKFGCSKGKATERVRVPANGGDTGERYLFRLTVTAPNGAKVRATTIVTVRRAGMDSTN